MAKGDELKGRVQEASGGLADDAELRQRGREGQEEAQARDELAQAREEADREAAEVADPGRRT